MYASFVQFHGALPKTNSLTPPSSVENYYGGGPLPYGVKTVSLVKIIYRPATYSI